MPGPIAPRDLIAQTMRDGQRVIVPHLAEMLKREGIETVDAAEERRRFWQRAATPEQEQQMWLTEMAALGLTELLPGSPQALDIGLKISKAVYPDRWDMAGGEGREHESEQAEWAWKMAQKGPPKAAQDEMMPTMAEGDY